VEDDASLRCFSSGREPYEREEARTKSVFDSLLRESIRRLGAAVPAHVRRVRLRGLLALRPSLDSLATAVEHALKRTFEAAGYTQVKTVLSSGNVAFDARAAPEAVLERRAEAAMAKHLKRVFYTIVRPTKKLQSILELDPYRGFRLPSNAKRVVTFLRNPHEAELSLPLEVDGAHILMPHPAFRALSTRSAQIMRRG